MGIGAGSFRCWVISALLVGLSLLGASSASATTYKVSTTAEFETAVASANVASAGPNTIELAKGAYSPKKKVEYTNAKAALTIVGPAAAPGAKLNGGSVEPYPTETLEVGAGTAVTLHDLTVTTGGGPGVTAVSDFGNLTVEDVLIAGNNGAGMDVQVGGTVTIRNSTLSDGLEYGLIDDGTASLYNTTVAFNHGGIDNASGTLNLTNTIVAENGVNGNCTGTATSSDHSLDSDGSCGVGTLSDKNPKLNSKLFENGGPTSTHVLQVGSPAIGAGDASTCLATDQRGLSRSTPCSIGATEYSATAPTITVPSNITQPAENASGAIVTYSASASSTVAFVESSKCTPASKSTFPVGTTTVNCTATDTQGNTATKSFTVTIEPFDAPELELPANQTVAAEGPAGATLPYTVTAKELGYSESELKVKCSPGSGSVFPLGETTVTCSAEDPASHTAHGSFTVTVKDMAPPPSIEKVPASITASATGGGGAIVTYTTPTASDIVDGTDSVTCLPASGAAFPIGETTVKCTSVDKAGNEAHASFEVTVKDTTSPVIGKVPANITVETESSSGMAVSYSNPTASDIVDGTDPVSCSPASGQNFPIGETRVTCHVADKAGNSATATFTVTVIKKTVQTKAPETKKTPETKKAPAKAKGGKSHHRKKRRPKAHHPRKRRRTARRRH
ncbi:MAG TPA: HYR domain-containing protein [Solirubrobacteraceae bacterium]|jgi:hypothetical protein|nr:HYR domain-containing protein [Solirubrobacteraceae bacterium]